MNQHLTTAIVLLAMAISALARGESIWVEAEKPTKASVTRHPWWYDKVKTDQLSGGSFITNWSQDKPGQAEYGFTAAQAGEYEFWVRANPVQAKLSYQLNGGAWTAIDMDKEPADSRNIAEDGKIDVRFIAWAKVGKVMLRKGINTVGFRMDSANNNHGALDCFIFSSEPFTPRGILKPGQIAEVEKQAAADAQGWFAFSPKADPFGPSAGFDLRGLNEKLAGEGGFIAAKGPQFIHSATGKPVRFWAVNGPSSQLKDPADIRQNARLLAKYGVNLARVHGGYFNENGDVDPAKVRHALDVVQGMKQEGIYTHLSIYFPLWLKPKANSSFLAGYDGNKHPFASLYFNQDFQKRYQEWWKAVLLTPGPDGKRMVDEPAVFGLELVNEDSYFFWTFATQNIPDPQLRILETQFGDWLKARHGSIESALAKWNGLKTQRDNAAEGRMGFRPLWNMFNEKTPRDKDTARFLAESQRGFYEQTIQFIRGLGFKGVITCSNWATASPQVFGPIEKYTYCVGDFIDRHGYFGCNHKGEFAEWSIRDGHTYSDRSALRFEAEEPGKPKLFVHPAMDIHYNDKPSMISETTWCRPNRYRSEAPLFYAAYGALQDTDAIVHFALDSSRWTVKPGFFMQPWTLMSPAQLGQFPAAAAIYRNGLVDPGQTLVELNLKIDDILNLAGTPLPQDAAFDELRLKDVPQGVTLKPGNVIDPLVHLAGKTAVSFTAQGGPARLADVSRLIDRAHQTVTSSTGQIKLDYGKGILTINAPAAQGLSGDLRQAGLTALADLSIESDLDLGHIIAVSLDGKPLASSSKILLQVMSEEKNADFKTEPVSATSKRITSIGHDPWMAKAIRGTVKFSRADAGQLKVTALDHGGYPAQQLGSASEIKLIPTTLYYLIQR